jgi:rhodanese-related sulfurtransferase
MTLSKITPLEAKRLVDDGGVLVDIRGRDEHARERIPGARNLPLGSAVKVETSAPVVFHCRSGGRTSANSATLAQAANSEA